MRKLSLNDADLAAVRQFCITQAIACGFAQGADVVAHARVLADFVLGTNDAEVIAAARALAEKVK